MSNYNISKGIGRTVGFKGLKAQYRFLSQVLAGHAEGRNEQAEHIAMFKIVWSFKAKTQRK